MPDRRREPMSIKVSMHNWMRPEPIETTIRELPNSPFSKAELQQIERTNAEKLFPRFKLA